MTKKEIELKGTNLSLIGRGKDSSGNQTVKLKFPNKKAFSIQTNGNLPKTKAILSSNRIVATIGQDDLETIKDEVVDYITKHGSALQKRMLKAYFKAGGGVGKRSTHSINQDRRFLSKEPHEQEYLPKRKGNYFAKGGEVVIKTNRNGQEDGLLVENDGDIYHIVYSADFGISNSVMPYGIVMPNEDVVTFMSDRKAKKIWKILKPKVDTFLLGNYFAGGGEISKKDKEDIAKLQKLIDSDNPMITDAVKEKAKKKIAELSKIEEVEEKIMFGKNTVHYVSRITLNNKDVEIGDKIILLEDITDKDILNNKKDVKIKISKSNKEILFPLSNLSREEPKKPKFKVGDSVMLKDGSMEMVIDSYKLDRSKEYVYSGHFKSKPSEKFSEKESELEVYNKKPKKYKLGDTWSSDFDYEGMMDYAEKVDSKTSLSTLEKLAESMTDVNYHEEAKAIYKLIDDKKKTKKEEPKKADKKPTPKPTPKKEVKAPKDSWKDKLAMLKGKKGYKGKIANEKKAVSGTKSRNIKRDLEKQALPKGKRISKGGSNQYGKSKGGNVYYENRANRSDIDPKEKFEKGGEIKNNGWGINTNW